MDARARHSSRSSLAGFALAIAGLWILCAPAPARGGDLTSASYTLRGAHLSGGGAAQLQSTAPSPRYSGSGSASGQASAVGFSGAGASLTSSAAGFWPVVAGDLEHLDVDGDGDQSFFDSDDDGDGLDDAVETNTGLFQGPGDTGTDPVAFDTDGDGFGDGFEVTLGSDPTNAASTPNQSVPSLGRLGIFVLVSLIALGAALTGRRSNVRHT